MRDSDQHTEDQYHDHMRRLGDIIKAFRDGEMNAPTKRRYIAEENMAYYRDDNIRSQSTGERLCQMPRIRNEIPGIIADASGVPYDVAKTALDRRRELVLAAHYAETRAEQMQLMADSRDAFYSILTVAAPGGRHARPAPQPGEHAP